MIDAERQERAIWKLSQAGYAARRDDAGRYVVRAIGRDVQTQSLASPPVAGLAALGCREAIYADHWIRRNVTPSA